MLSYEESLKILKETNALLEGHFILSSGLHSSQYIQCAKLLSFPEKAEIVCASLSSKIKSTFKNIDIISFDIIYLYKTIWGLSSDPNIIIIIFSY